MKDILKLSILALLIYSCSQKPSENLYLEASEEHNISKALQYIKSQTKERRLANGHFLAGYLYKKKFKYDSAVHHFIKALWYYKKTENKTQQSFTLRVLGNVYRENNNHMLALELYEKAKHLTDNREYQNKLNVAIARCHIERSQWPEAQKLLRIAEQYFENNQDSYWLAKTYLNLGKLFHNHAKYQNKPSDYGKALAYAKKANQIFEKPEKKAAAMNNIGNAYLAMGDLHMSEHFLTESIKNSGSDVEKAMTYYNLGRLYKAKGDFELAIDYHTKSFALCTSLTYEFNHASMELMEIYIEQDEKHKATAFNREFHKIQEKFLEERRKLSNKMNSIMLDNLESALVIQKEKDRVFKSELKMIAIFVGACLIIIFVIYELVKEKKHADKMTLAAINSQNELDSSNEKLSQIKRVIKKQLGSRRE